jgi:hypothetical protein
MDGGKSLEDKPSICMFWARWLVAEGEVGNVRLLVIRLLCKRKLQTFTAVSGRPWSGEGSHAGVLRSRLFSDGGCVVG